MINSIKSKSFLAFLLFCIINTINIQKVEASPQINQLKKDITKMFAIFLPAHPELEKRKNKIIANLNNYGALLNEHEISKYNSMIEQVNKFRNYIHLSYNYSVFTKLEKLHKQ
jgi:hypothetical protein